MKQLGIVLTMVFLAVNSSVPAEEKSSTDAASSRQAGRRKGKPVDKAPAVVKVMADRSGKTSEEAIAECVETIVKRGLTPGKDEATSLAVTTDALGLLATGDKQHLELVKAYARDRAKACEKLDVMENQALKKIMDAGLLNVLFCEYYLLTKDEEVMPGIKALSTYLAFAQSKYGSWGNDMPDVKTKGLYGEPEGWNSSDNFGTDNNVTLAVATSLVLAEKCGISSKPIKDAIERARILLRYYADKGAIPINLPKPNRSNNSDNRSGHAAIFFHLIGDKVPAKYFARLALTSEGHSVRWITTWSEEGDALLELCHGRKVLVVTGREGTAADKLTKKEIEESIAAGAFNPKKATDEELIANLTSFSAPNRYQAARQMQKKSLVSTERLLEMLKSKNRYERLGALAGFRFGAKPVAVLEPVLEILEKETDEAILFHAMTVAATRYGGKGEDEGRYRSALKKAAPGIIQVAARDYPGKDPMNRIALQVVETTIDMIKRTEFSPAFGEQGSELADLVPAETLIPVLKVWLNSPYVAARKAGASVAYHVSEKDMEPLYEDLYLASVNDRMNRDLEGNAILLAGYKAMAKHRFQEAMDLCLELLKKEGKVGGAMMALQGFNINTLKRDGWDVIEPILAPYLAKEQKGHHAGWKKQWEEKLKETEPAVELRSIKPYLTEAGLKANRRLFPKDFE